MTIATKVLAMFELIAVPPGGCAVASGDAGIDSLNYIRQVKKLSDIRERSNR